MADQPVAPRGSPTPTKTLVAIGLFSGVVALGSARMANPHHVRPAFLVGLAIGVLFSTPAILLTRRMILSGQQTTEGLLWPFRLVMWGIMVGIAIGAVIGDPTGDTVAISAILAVLWVLMIEFLVRRMKARHSS